MLSTLSLPFLKPWLRLGGGPALAATLATGGMLAGSDGERMRLVVATGLGLLTVTAVFWHNGRLRRELAQRRRVEAELRAAHDRLEELNNEKTQLLDMAAHDLRNPLTGMMLSLGLMDTDDAAARRQMIGEVTVLTRHMVQLINDLLDVQMLEHGRRTFKLAAVDVAAVVRAAMQENRLAAARKRITLVTEPVPERCTAWVDAVALRQIVDNLLSNAVKYSPTGGCVWLLPQPRGNQIRLVVRDEGPGISAADMRRLFSKYARLGARPTAGESSVGLGLAIVRRLAEGMGGTVACQTELGRGATFVVDLPAAGCCRQPGQPAAVLA